MSLVVSQPPKDLTYSLGTIKYHPLTVPVARDQPFLRYFYGSCSCGMWIRSISSHYSFAVWLRWMKITHTYNAQCMQTQHFNELHLQGVTAVPLWGWASTVIMIFEMFLFRYAHFTRWLNVICDITCLTFIEKRDNFIAVSVPSGGGLHSEKKTHDFWGYSLKFTGKKRPDKPEHYTVA